MNDIEKLIHETIDEVNEFLPSEGRMEKSPQTVIVGAGSNLDSLSIVNFLTTLEEKVAASTGRAISLLTEDALTNPDGPLRTIGRIEKFLSGQIT